ncbi:MAG: RNA polymerase sigma-70 factor (ECF subfamily), partial [Planctomycetota bacterium]
VERQALDHAANGDLSPLGDLLETYRPRLRRTIATRMDPRLRCRIDPEDVLQESLVEVTRRVPSYLEKREMPFFLWVRFLTGQKLLQLNRTHFGAAARDIRCELPMERQATPDATSFMVASALLDNGPTPSQVMMKKEERGELLRALDDMDAMDREVLVMRHFERLNTLEVSHVLGLTESGARRRYGRALRKLQAIIQSFSLA